MAIYTEELLSSRLDVGSLQKVSLAPFLVMLHKMFSRPHFLLANGFMVSAFIVSSPIINRQGLCIDVMKLYDRAATGKPERRVVEALIKIAEIHDESAAARYGVAPRPGVSRSEMRLQFVVNTLHHMGLLVSKLSIERGKTLDEMEKDLPDSLL